MGLWNGWTFFCHLKWNMLVYIILVEALTHKRPLGGLIQVEGSWFSDLISLSYPENLERTLSDQYGGAVGGPIQNRLSVIAYPPTAQSGRKSVRETTDMRDPRPLQTFGTYSLNPMVQHPNRLPDDRSTDTGITNTPDRGRIFVPVGDRNNLLSQEVAICRTLTGLTRRQRQLCLQHSGIVWAMLEGTQLGLHECVHQFQHEQWNCSAVNLLYQMQVDASSVPAVSGLEGILQRGSRETAFLSSSWSAGVVQAITRSCSRGQMSTCDCDPHRREVQDQDTEGVFTWGGCSDPIKFGMQLASHFLDANDRENREKAIFKEEQLHGPRTSRPLSRRWRMQMLGQSVMANAPGFRHVRDINNGTIQSISKQKALDLRTNLTSTASTHRLTPQELQAETLRIMETNARSLMNLHNRRTGRRLVWQNRIRKCKCHGVSGACSMRTCWQRANEFRQVGKLLKVAYDEAVRVGYDPRKDQLKAVRSDPYANRQRAWSVNNQQTNYILNKGGRYISSQSRLVPTPFPKLNNDLSDGSSNTWRMRRWPRGTNEMGTIPKRKLIYLEESPNYCRHDSTIGHLGIGGRLCNASTTDEPNSCSRLCCDMGFDTIELETERKCDCKFFWCCEVRCRLCRERTVEHRCKH